ncbi:hypothetical protein [Legionella waltersii]|uniref:Uncharacterized protein n=1 Tax=Legionella waltersii TaxID=66969 RepID=A0A0W1A125_9GAMM|nr:hypothetical protein [Legionella waltersii]KTD74982.1 hypothetical protein Lwal_3023 [Legionella waltersii]SNV08316.1 Uncharacterised protein [Legionella waltersii]
MQDCVETINKDLIHAENKGLDDLHNQMNQSLMEAQHLVFEILPELIKQIIEQKLWQEKNHINFGEYALDASSNGLNVNNNNKLWLLKRIMDIYGQHAVEWSDVLTLVDGAARNYAKKNKIQMKALHRSLDYTDKAQTASTDDAITYLPSRTKSEDGQLLKLRHTDQEAYHKVTNGEMSLKEAFPKKPRKYIEPIEWVKTKFNSLSSSDRESFIAWIEQQKDS